MTFCRFAYDLKKLSACEIIARNFIRLAAGKSLLITMPIRGSVKDCAGRTHCNGLAFQQMHDGVDEFHWDFCSSRGLACGQIIQYLGLQHLAEGVRPWCPEGNLILKEYRITISLRPEGLHSLRNSQFYRNCRRTVGDEWFEYLSKERGLGWD